MLDTPKLIPAVVVLSLLSCCNVLAQEPELSRTTEKTIKLVENDQIARNDLFTYIGDTGKGLVYYFKERESNERKIYDIQVPDYEILSAVGYSYLLDDFTSFTSILVKNEYSFYSIGVFDKVSEYGYQEIHLNHSGRDYILDSIYNADKKIHSSFSSDGRYLLVNTLNTLSDYYNPAQDNRIVVYDLSEIDQGKIGKEYIPCLHCSDSYLIGDQLFFTVGGIDGYGGFSNKDTYVAPWGNLKDSVKVASNTNIVAISPDGKYVLGTRFFDTQKMTAVIVDVKRKTYQMLLGRNYAAHRAFYSSYEGKFAFDFKGYLIFVDFPNSYPFDALKWRNEDIPYWTDEDFWEKYKYPPFSEN